MDGLPALIDQHSHGAVHGELGLGSFETHLAAAVGAHGPAPAGTSYFDSLTGLAIRRWCPRCSAWNRGARPPTTWPADARWAPTGPDACCCGAPASARSCWRPAPPAI